MPLQNIQRVDPISQTSWDSGMINSLPPEELPDDAAALIENFEFDELGNLRSRFAIREGFLDSGFTDLFTSIFTALYSSGTRRFYVTAANDLYEMTGGVPGITLNDITGAFVFPSGNRWYWVMFDDFAIGIHGSSTERPIKISSAGTVTTLNASAPFASHGVLWNNRLWLAGVGSNRNTIFGSAINDPEDWTSTGDNGAITLGIDINDGDFIRALSVFRGNLIVYKNNKINVVSSISAPATIPSNLRVDVYTTNVGTSYPATVQDVLDDQVFLSHAGITSLALAPLGDIRGSVLSNNIEELKKVGVVLTDSVANGHSACAITYPQKQQYLVFLPSNLNQGLGNVLWVMDYSDIQQKDVFGNPKVRWCKFTGDVVGSAYSLVLETYESLLVGVIAGTLDPSSVIGLYVPIGTLASYSNANIATAKTLLTRAFGNSRLRSLWDRFCITLNKHTTDVAFNLDYFYDNYLTAKAGGYSKSLTGTPANNHRSIWHSFRKNDSGRKANLVQIRVQASTIDQGFTVKGISLTHTELNHRQAKTSWVSD